MDEIDFCECFVVAWFLDVEDGDDVLVVEVPEELHLTQSPQTEHGMVKRRDLLDGNLLARGLVQGGATTTVSTISKQSILKPLSYQTTPYAPSPTTSWMSYCSETLKEILLELPLPAGARDMSRFFCTYGRGCA